MATVVALESFAGRFSKDKLGPERQDKEGNALDRQIEKQGESIVVHKGQLFDSNHPAVKKWPQMFGQQGDVRMVVEQATAAPGEKRA